MYRIEIKSGAEKFLSKLPSEYHRRVKEKIDDLSHNPFPAGYKKLKAIERKVQYSVRSGHYRVIYEVIKDEILVLIVKIGHRKDVYRQS